MADQAEHTQNDFWADAGFVGRSLARVRGGRGGRGGRGRSRGGRGQRGNGISRAESRKENARYSDRGQGQVQRARTRGGRGYKRGRRTVRRRHKPENKVVRKDVGFRGIANVQQNIGRDSPKSSGGEEWDADRARRIYADEGEDNSAGISESDDNAQMSGDEYDDRGQDYADAYGGKAKELMDDSEEEEDGDGDRDEDDEEGDEDGEDDGNGDGYPVMDDGDVGDEGEGHGDEDDGTPSLSSDYSD